MNLTLAWKKLRGSIYLYFFVFKCCYMVVPLEPPSLLVLSLIKASLILRCGVEGYKFLVRDQQCGRNNPRGWAFVSTTIFFLHELKRFKALFNYHGTTPGLKR